MFVLGCAIALIWACSLLAVAMLFYRAERGTRNVAADWDQAEYRSRRSEPRPAVDAHRSLSDQAAAHPHGPAADP